MKRRGRASGGKKTRGEKSLREGHTLGTCWPVLCELEAGIIRTKRPEKNRKTLHLLLREVRIWPVDWTTVRLFGQISVQAQEKGRILSHVDLVLAAMAQDHDAILLTSDKDFSIFPDLAGENWIE